MTASVVNHRKTINPIMEMQKAIYAASSMILQKSIDNNSMLMTTPKQNTNSADPQSNNEIPVPTEEDVDTDHQENTFQQRAQRFSQRGSVDIFLDEQSEDSTDSDGDSKNNNNSAGGGEP